MKKERYQSPDPPGEKAIGLYKPGYMQMKCPQCSQIYTGHSTSLYCKKCALKQLAKEKKNAK